MADKKISALTASTTPLAGTEVLPIVQSGSTVKVSVANLTAGRAVSASTLTLNKGATGVIANITDGIAQTLQVSSGSGYIGFLNPNYGSIVVRNPTDASTFVTVSNLGVVTVEQNNLVIGTAGKGIAYPVYGGGSAVQPVFSATANTTQSINAATWTKVDFANELFDSNNNFASSTYSPTVPGYYQINASVYWASDPSSIIVAIYRSGAPLVELGRMTTSAAGTINGSALVYADGFTHTFEIYVRSVNANTINDGTSTALVTFNGSLVRGG